MTENTQHPHPAPAAAPKPPAPKAPTPATTSPTKFPEKVMDFNSAETAKAESQPNPSSSAAADAPQAAEKRRGRPPRDPNATPTPATPAAPPKPVAQMTMGELLKEKAKSVDALMKAHEALGLHLPRLSEIAEAIKSKLA